MLKNEINSSYLTNKDKRPAGHILYLHNSKLKRNHTFTLLSERNYSKVFNLHFFLKERFVVLIFFVSNLVEIAEGYEEEVKKLKDVKILQIDG